MRKINLSNDVKRDAEVAFGTTFHRPSPVYKTADGKKSVNERLVRATMKTIDDTEEPVEEEIDELDFSMF